MNVVSSQFNKMTLKSGNHRIPVLIAILFICGIPSFQIAAQEQTATPEAEIQRLVELLGHPEFEIREDSEAKLLAAGSSALLPIDEACLSGDIEVRLRAQRIALQLRQTQFDASIAAFIEGGSEATTTLPTWEVFSSMAGDNPESRKLFALTYQSTPELFQTLYARPEIARIRYQRLMRTLTRARFRSLNAATVIFLDVLAKPEIAGMELPSVQLWKNEDQLRRTGNYLASSTTSNFIEVSGFKRPFRQLIVRWLELLDDSPANTRLRLKIIGEQKLASQSSYVLDQIIDEDASVPIQSEALVVFSRIGNREHVRRLSKLLQNKQIVGHFPISDGEKLQVQVRDVALAMCLRLCEQDLREYGFDIGSEAISISQAGFENSEQRTGALQKWQRFYQEEFGQEE